MHKPPQKKSFASYLIPFLLIFLLMGIGWYVVKNQITVETIRQIFRAPDVQKDQKVKAAYSEGEIEIKPWRDESWKIWDKKVSVEAGDSLRTKKDALLVLRFFDSSEIRLSSQSEIKIMRLDANPEQGDHIAIEIVAGKLWRRGKAGNTTNADFVINTEHFVIQMTEAAVVDVSADPEAIRVIGGRATANIIEKVGNNKKPLSKIDFIAGQEIIWTDAVLEQLRSGEKSVAKDLDKEYLESEWYLWNAEKEERLGYIVNIVTAPKPKENEALSLELLEGGLVTIDAPLPDQETATRVMVRGTYQKDRISKIFVNGETATLGLENAWEHQAILSEKENSLTITSEEKDATVQKLVAVFQLKVDATGPTIGNIKTPPLDLNGNGVISGDTLELVGEISSDAVKVCVSHNDDEPYCLKQFKPGNKVYTYRGAVKYGNVIKGKNKYVITAYDSFDNAATKNVYYFKDIPKPSEKISEPETSNQKLGTSPQPVTSLTKPVILIPDPSIPFQTSESAVTVSGTVDTHTQTILVNNKKAPYQPGNENFEFTYPLEQGENLIKIQSEDSKGNKSKTAVLTVMYVQDLNKPNE